MEAITGILALFLILFVCHMNEKSNKKFKELMEKQAIKEQKEKTIIKEKQEKNINSPYKLNQNIFTDSERFFYKILKEITYNMDLIIMTKVRLADIIYTNEYDYTYFNKIKAKHIDFVLIDNNGKIKLLIELDDKSHENQERKERDKFLNKIFENLNINLLRIPAKYIYNKEELEKKIKESL